MQQGQARCTPEAHVHLQVLLDLQSNIRVADFGLAAITTPMSGNLQMACGTPEFTAPEILRGREYVGTAVDIWSLGVMLYEMLQVGCGAMISHCEIRKYYQSTSKGGAKVLENAMVYRDLQSTPRD